jgi:hypothetical protein
MVDDTTLLKIALVIADDAQLVSIAWPNFAAQLIRERIALDDFQLP